MLSYIIMVILIEASLSLSLSLSLLCLSQVDSIYPELAELLVVVLRMLLPKSCEFTVDQGTVYINFILSVTIQVHVYMCGTCTIIHVLCLYWHLKIMQRCLKKLHVSLLSKEAT